MYLRQLFNLGVACTLLPSISPSAHAQDDEHLGVYTSPIDITGWSMEFVATAPDRETGDPVEIPVPPGQFGPKIDQLISNPLSDLFDQYWNKKDPRTNLTPREAACIGIDAQISATVAKRGPSYHAYDISCELAATGRLLVNQVGSTFILAYLLSNNTASFASTSPQTCNQDHGSPFCPNDPRFSVTFATELVIVMRTPSACGLIADKTGTAYVVSASINPENGAAEIAGLLNDGFVEAEVAITDATKVTPLPLDDAFAELRASDACRGNSPIALFSDFESYLDPSRGIVLHATHPGISAPSFTGLVDLGDDYVDYPSFFRPTLWTSQPRVAAGKSVQLGGQYFPTNTNLSTELHLTLDRYRYNACFGGQTELEWGPTRSATSALSLPAGQYGVCMATFNPKDLTPATSYQFRARDCDVITCSPWSETLEVSTEAIDPAKGMVDLTLDGSIPLGVTVVDGQGRFSTSVVVPEGTTPGKHIIHGAHREVQADVEIQVADPASQASIMMVGLLDRETGCPNHPITSAVTDSTFRLFGSGFSLEPVTIQLDSVSGAILGTATVGADGSFCEDMQSAPSAAAGAHSLVAVQGGAVVARAAVSFVTPSFVR